jgi:Asp-tRNA(Asn)/Glu-tRNA(Gln) amidotransferase A subunit family amidase
MTTPRSNRLDLDHIVTRRKFLGTTALSSAALLSGGITSLLRQSALASRANFDFVEKSISELQAAMVSGELTSRQLTHGYIRRIQQLNPLINSVIELNPNAMAIAAQLDVERRGGHVRGPLHGIPLLVKDNIATDDQMQTTAGPMARSVSDVATLLGVLQSPFGEVIGHQLPDDYTQFLDPNALDGAVIGRDVRFFDYSYYGSGIPGDELTVAFAENALSVMESLGATIVDVDTGDVFAYNGDESTALLYEFRAQIADYLATLTHTNMRTLADLIAFNDAHCTQEMPYYGQEVFLLSEMFPGYPNDPTYIAARTHARTAARSGIDDVINSGVDAIVAPHLTNSTGPAVSGYPNLSLPVGIRDSGRPAGMLMYSTFLHEPELIGFGYALEQALNARQQPQFLGSIIPIPNADLCDGHQNHGQPHLPHGKIH